MTQWLAVQRIKVDRHITIKMSRFLYLFNLRQGAILIAVQHIALSACALILLLVGIAHAQEMMDMLNADMEDNAEREGTILVDEEDLTLLHNGPLEATNNQQKFKIAQNLAMMMVFLLYGSLVGTAIYLVFCVALFYGAAKYKKEYIVPWALFATFAILVLIGVIILGDNSATLVRLCGGHALYRFGSILILIGHLYCIVAVTSFIFELNSCKKGKISESIIQLNADVADKNLLVVHQMCKLPEDDASRLNTM